MRSIRKPQAISAIEKHGLLLTFPLANRADPPSLWAVAYPRTPMRWEWDEGGDNRVASLWRLREELSRSRRVVYAKWLQGRATFFSRSAFTALRSLYLAQRSPLSRDASNLLAILQESSPRSTKELKRESGLIGRDLEPTYERALKELWRCLHVVGFGEIDDGAFPSLAIGATSLVFEELDEEAKAMSASTAQRLLQPLLSSPAILRQLQRQKLWPFPSAEAPGR